MPVPYFLDRFLLTCIKALRSSEKSHYLDININPSSSFPPSPSSSAHSAVVCETGSETEKNAGVKVDQQVSAISRTRSSSSSSGSNKTRDREREKAGEVELCPFSSHVTRLMDKLLFIFERIR